MKNQQPIQQTVSVAEAIRELGCDVSNVITNENPDTIEWVDPPEDFVPPSRADIVSKVEELRERRTAQQYRFDRYLEYPNLAEQLDYIYHNGITKWKSDMIKPVKDKYPKG